MRTSLALASMALLGTLMAVGTSVPAATHAAAAALPAQQPAITGTLVARPQSTLPSTLLLQVGGQTIQVSLSLGTAIQRSDGSAVNPADLNDGDTLQVVGTPTPSGAIAATLITDLSLPVSTLDVRGILATTPNPATTPPSGTLCLANASVSIHTIAPNVATSSPCPTGQLPIYLTSSTAILRADSSAASMAALQAGDSLRVIGSLVNTQLIATQVQDLSLTAPSPSLTVKGVLAAWPTRPSAPVTLCLANASVSTNGIAPNVAPNSPCPTGQLPVYVTTSTSIARQDSSAAALYELSAGDVLRVTGSLVNTQLVAAQVQDLSLQAPYASATGTILYVSPFTNPGYITMRLSKRHFLGRANAAITVYVQPQTRIITANGITNDVEVLNPGQQVTVAGVYNAPTHSFTTTARIVVH